MQLTAVDDMPWAQAYATARDLATPLPSTVARVNSAAGQFLAAPILCTRPVPAFDNAAMDGYAVAGPGPWRVAGRILAGPGGAPPPLTPGTAVEIATGAPVPPGISAVLPYEDCRFDGTHVTGTPGPRAHVRRAGEDLAVGDVVLPAGRRVTATVQAAAVQSGTDQVLVHRRPTVTLLVTGDEVITDGTPGPGQVRDTFTGLVDAITERAGGVLSSRHHRPDSADLLRAALDQADSDVIVVSGSSSAGAADHLHELLAARDATWHVRGVACRPGHPQALATLEDGRRVVSLPGNPYAGLVAALTLLEPLLSALAGGVCAPRSAPVTGTARLVPGGVRIVPVFDHGGLAAAGGSASLHRAAAADALAVLSEDWVSGAPAPILTLP